MSSDWNEEFTKLVRQGIGDTASQIGPEASQTADAPAEAPATRDSAVAGPDSAPPGPDSDQSAAARRASISAALVRLGFLSADRATPHNPAVEVLSELLPLDAEVELCLTCHEFSCSDRYEFAHATGRFADPATIRRGGGGLYHSGPDTFVKGPRHELVVCTQDGVYWTQSRAYGEGEDSVTLYSVPFGDLLGATVRHRHKGVVEVYIDDGPTMSFRVVPDEADAFQACVDRAAQSDA